MNIVILKYDQIQTIRLTFRAMKLNRTQIKARQETSIISFRNNIARTHNKKENVEYTEKIQLNAKAIQNKRE